MLESKGVAVDKIQFPYRTNTHLQLLHVIAESGSWEKYGLDVDYDRRITASEAHQRVLAGDIEFVGGNHVSPYGRRARGDRWVYIGQSVNIVPGRKLCVRADSDINGIADLREKVVGSRGSHPGLNDWLQLKQFGLDTDRDEVAIVDQYGARDESGMDAKNPNAEEDSEPLWQWVRDKKVDATFLQCPQPFFAERAGLRLIDIPDLPMIYFTTISTSLHFTERHPDIVERFLKGFIEGIHFYKTQPEKTADIIRRRYDKAGIMDDPISRKTQATLGPALSAKLYPTPEAISNVYAEGVRQDPDAKRIDPLALWDLHFIRQIDDSGFVDDLYAKTPVAKA